MAHPRLTFGEDALLRPGTQTSRVGPIRHDDPKVRRDRLKARIRFLARQTFVLRKALKREGEARRYIFRKLRVAWWHSKELYQHTQDDAEIMLANVASVIAQVQAKGARIAEREDINRKRAAQARAGKAAKAPAKDKLLAVAEFERLVARGALVKAAEIDVCREFKISRTTLWRARKSISN